MRRIAIASVALLALGAGGARVYHNDAMKIRGFAPPAGWELAPQSSYPRLLAYYSHAEGARLTLSAQKIAPGTTAAQLVEQSRAALERQGFAHLRATAEGERERLDGDLDGGRRFLKQLYVVAGNIGYVITLISPTAAAAHMSTDFEEALRSLQLVGEPAPPSE
jgi:hypothetical protein